VKFGINIISVALKVGKIHEVQPSEISIFNCEKSGIYPKFTAMPPKFGKVQTLDWTTGMDYWTGIFWFLIHSLVQGGVILLKTNELLGTFSSRRCFVSNLNSNVD